MPLYIIELINPAKSPITPPPSAISVSLLSIPLSKSSAIVFSRISKLLPLSPDLTKQTNISNPAFDNEFLTWGSISEPKLSSHIKKIFNNLVKESKKKVKKNKFLKSHQI